MAAGDTSSVHFRRLAEVAFSGPVSELHAESILLGTGQWAQGHRLHLLCKGLKWPIRSSQESSGWLEAKGAVGTRG